MEKRQKEVKMDKKRDRSANFSPAEVRILLSMAEKKRKIIENKKTDAVTNKEKDVAWRNIETMFNAVGVGDTFRSWPVLKRKYEGLKKTTKKKASQHRQELYRTGGGPPVAPPAFSDVEEKILEICSSNIHGLSPRHDSDNIQVQVPDCSRSESPESSILVVVQDAERENKEAHDDPSLEIFGDTLIEDPQDDPLTDTLPIQIEDEAVKENNWDSWNPNALKTKITSQLKTTKAGVTAKLDQLTTARLQLLEFQLEMAKREFQFKKEEHDLRMLHLNSEENRRQELHELNVKKINSE